MEKIGYKRGILVGLLTCATGALLFIPAASVRLYGFFLFALFVMACGQGVLEVAANPYVTILGPPESSERRLNFAQSFNSVGAVVTPIFGAAFILSGVEYSRAQLAAMTPAQLQAYEVAEANTVKGPYLVIAGLFLAVAALIYFSQLPEVHEEDDAEATQNPTGGLRGLWPYKHLLKGVLAQFFYVGAQVGVASFVIRFAQYSHAGTAREAGGKLSQAAPAGIHDWQVCRLRDDEAHRGFPPALAFRNVGLALPYSRAAGNRSGADVGAGPARVLSFDHVSHNLALSLKHLGPHTKLGSSLLVMSIIGGAVFPAIMGYISDMSSIRLAFWVPFLCHLYVLYFAARGYRPALDLPKQPAMRSIPVEN